MLAESGRLKECRLLTSSSVGHDRDFAALDLEGGPRDPSFGTPLRRSDLVAVALGVAGLAIAVALVLTGGVATDTTGFAAVLVANIATLLVGGLLWRHARPSSPFGYLLLGESVLVFLSSFAGSSVPALYLRGVLGAWAAAL